MAGFGGTPGQFGGTPGQFGGTPGQFGGTPGQFGGTPGQFGGTPGQFGGTPGQFGGTPGRYGGSPGQFGGTPGQFGGTPGQFGGTPGRFGGTPGQFGGTPGQFGGTPGRFGGTPGQFGGTPGQFGGTPGQFGGTPGQFGGTPGRFGGTPGQFGGTPGQFGGTPGQFGGTPGQFGGTPGRYGGSPGQFGGTPGQFGGTPGQFGGTPGRFGGTPGQFGGTPGQFGGTPGRFGGTPGQFGGTPGQFGGTPGQFGGTPGQFGGTPGRFGGTPGQFGGTPGLFGGTPGQFGGIARQPVVIPRQHGGRLNVAPGGQINTHTASIHASASQSALNLFNAYDRIKFSPEMADMRNYFVNNMQDLRGLIGAGPDDDLIKTSVNGAIAHIMRSYSTDPTSNLTLRKVFELILVGINQLNSEEIKKDAYLQLCASLYFLRNEYGMGTPSCDPGFFNGIIYSQQTTLPNEVSMVVQTLELASSALQDKMNNFAKQVLDTGNFVDVNEFETEVLRQATEQNIGGNIMAAIADEFYTLLGYPNPTEARRATSEDLSIHCVRLFGSDTGNLFANIPLDYEKLYTEKAHTPGGGGRRRG